MREDNVNNCDDYVNCDDMMKILYHKNNFYIYGNLKYIQSLAHCPELFSDLFLFFLFLSTIQILLCASILNLL